MSRFQLTKKGKMYECQAFFPSGFPKKWKYVRDLESFSRFLTKDHSSWKYFNVYEKGSKNYLKRFYPGNSIPKVLALLVLFLPDLTNPLFTCSKTSIQLEAYSMKNTTSSKTTSNTSNNGIYNPATILTLEGGAIL